MHQSAEPKKKPITFLARVILLAAVAAPALALGIDRQAVEKALSHPNLKGALTGVEIRSLDRGDVVFARDERTPLILASNNKLVTTASALYHLGPDFDFRTRVYARGHVENGKLRGDLIVRGGGDPCLSGLFHEKNPLGPVDELSAAVAGAGIKEVTGSLIMDDLVFDRTYVAPGWPGDQLNHYYCAPVSGLSVMKNTVEVKVMPADMAGMNAKLSLFPPGTGFGISGVILTTSRKNQNLVSLFRPDDHGIIRVSGKTSALGKSSVFSVSVRTPPAYFGSIFMHSLKEAGVLVDGGMYLAEDALDYDGNIEKMTLLGTVSSDLKTAVFVTNKTSNNHCAEHLFKAAGWKVAGKGSFSTGEAAARELFRGLGAVPDDSFQMADGSGLSRGNRFSAHAVVTLLSAVYNSRIRDTFMRSLPISGVDGSLKNRMKEDAYTMRVRAKTGWIRDVSALSGYVQSRSDGVYAFSIIFNGYKGNNSVMKSIQDSICRAIVDG